MKPSKRLSILKKLYLFDYVDQKELEARDANIVKIIKQEMREEQERNREKIHLIQLDEFLDENNIRSLDY